MYTEQELSATFDTAYECGKVAGRQEAIRDYAEEAIRNATPEEIDEALEIADRELFVHDVEQWLREQSE